MKVRRTLICFFVLTLQDGNTGLLNAGHDIFTGTEGESITVACSFTFSGGKKFFCKHECKDILIETTGDRAENDRYSVEYSKTSFLSYPLLYVSITQLTKSDSGRYRCGLGRTLFPGSHKDFELIVTDATSKQNWTLRPFSASVPSASTPTTTQSLSSSSGSFTSPSASPKTTTQSGQLQSERTTTTPPAHSGKLLYVGLILVVMFFLLSLAVLLFCRRMASKPKEPPVETEYASVSEANRVYADIREDRRSRSPPVEISSVYTYAKYTKPNGAETNDDYSFADPNCTTAASSQHKAEDDSSKLIYSEVDFSSSIIASLDGAPPGNTNDVIYSLLQVEASSDASQAEDTSPPLHSTITLPPQ